VYQPKGSRDEAPLAEGSADFVPLIRQQALTAIEEADVVVMVVDSVQGITAADEEIAEILRRTSKPVVIAANKADTIQAGGDAVEFYALGVGEVIAISAIHGLGVGDLLDIVVESFGSIDIPDEDDDDDHLKIAIVGKPNAGKSTLLNHILGEERAIVSPIAGTTRDAIDTDITWHGQTITLIDTAGIRRRGKIEPGVEKFSVIRSMDAIERCHVALLIIDAVDGVTEQDEHIAGYILEYFKSVVIVINKWDAIENKTALTMTDFQKKVRERLHFLPYAPIIFISALTGQRIHQVLETASRVWEARFFRIQTSHMNQLLRDALQRHPPPAKGTRRLKMYFATQVATNPPVFLFNVNDRKLVHFTYKRFLENRIREEFPFEGTPIRLSFRDGTGLGESGSSGVKVSQRREPSSDMDDGGDEGDYDDGDEEE
jgi:GTP-binding protein